MPSSVRVGPGWVWASPRLGPSRSTRGWGGSTPGLSGRRKRGSTGMWGGGTVAGQNNRKVRSWKQSSVLTSDVRGCQAASVSRNYTCTVLCGSGDMRIIDQNDLLLHNHWLLSGRQALFLFLCSLSSVHVGMWLHFSFMYTFIFLSLSVIVWGVRCGES